MEITPDSVIQAIAFASALLYLWWEYHADAKVWIASMITPALSMYTYWRSGLYADFAINIYYLAIGIYGYAAWTRWRGNKQAATEKGKKDDMLPISHMPARQAVWATVAMCAIWGLIYLILANFTNSTVPVADALTTAISIVALWMLARKYIEQWWVWIACDMICVGLYWYKGIYLFALRFLIYSIVAVFGFYNWLKIMKRQKN